MRLRRAPSSFLLPGAPLLRSGLIMRRSTRSNLKLPLLYLRMFPSAVKYPSRPRRGRFPNGYSGPYGSTHIGGSRSCRLAAFLILLPVLFNRKLFTFVVTLNVVGLVFAASGHFPYADRWTSAMALGNLNFAILMRNELFGRFLYLFVNTCFAKVAISLS